MAQLDPYLQIARQTGFVDYHPSYGAATRLDFLLELAAGGAATLRAAAAGAGGILVNEAHLDANSAFVTARMTLQELDGLVAAGAIERVELAESVRHQRTLWPKDKAFDDAARTVPPFEASRSSATLAAIIDDGCPFAHAEFRKPDGVTTRVVVLWDMDPNPEFAHPQSGAPGGFFRGREVPGSQLDAWMAAATTGGVLDEDKCYAAAGYSTVLKASLTHGSHLLGRFAGKSYTRAGGAPDAAAAADIAFLQIPRRSLEAPDGGSMHACILDGLRYLRRVAEKSHYQKCIVTCAMGSLLGPHDGTSLFERALDAFLAEPGIPFTLVFAAGNADGQRLHAELSPDAQGKASVLWMLPGDNEAASFAELWMPAGASGVAFTATADGATQVLAGGAFAPVGPRLVAVQTGERLTLRYAPTRSSELQTPAGQQGFASVQVEWTGGGTVHGYVAWGGENLGCPRSTKQTEWRAAPAATGTLVHGGGTLLGDACGTSAAIVVAGGYVGANNAAHRARAAYSSTGPIRAAHRKGPTCLALSDEDSAVQGIPGPGTRSGSTREYVWGTSVAAPQVARALVNGEALPTRGASPLPPEEEVGEGFLS